MTTLRRRLPDGQAQPMSQQPSPLQGDDPNGAITPGGTAMIKRRAAAAPPGAFHPPVEVPPPATPMPQVAAMGAGQPPPMVGGPGQPAPPPLLAQLLSRRRPFGG
jgi:hypothetical protein